jgi:hypothetical protein
VTQLVKMLQGHEILSSGPAIPQPRELAMQAAVHVLPGGGTIKGITEGVAKLRSPAMMTGILNTLDALAQRTSKAIGGGVSRIFGEEAAAGAAGAAESVTKVTRENFPHVARAVGDYNANLDRLAQESASQTSGFGAHAPGASQALAALAARGVGHLDAHTPKGGPRLALDPESKPSASELAQFNRVVEITERPTRALDHLARGTYTEEHHQTLQTVYPRLAEEMRLQVLDRLAKEMAKGTRLPHRIRFSLGLFLGTDLDSSMTPQSIAAAQAAYATQPTAPSQGMAPRADVKIGIGDRLATGTQGLTQRLGA